MVKLVPGVPWYVDELAPGVNSAVISGVKMVIGFPLSVDKLVSGADDISGIELVLGARVAM